MGRKPKKNSRGLKPFNLRTDCGILRTNSFESVGNDSVIFEKMSRVNHGCSSAANAVYDLVNSSHASGRHEVRLTAVKEIKSGNDILIDYIGDKSASMVLKERQEFLLSKHGFRCTCVKCYEDDKATGFEYMRSTIR